MQSFLNYKKYIFIIGGFVCLTIFSVIYYFKSSSDNITLENDITITETTSTKEENVVGYVDVKGAVKKPGVYQFKEGDKVIDAITLAGGLNKSAVTNNINLSKKLTNEMVIYIYTKSELTTKKTTTSVITVSTTAVKQNIIDESIKAEINEACNCETTPSNGSINNNTDKKININTADKNTLITLSGIGEAKAEAIIAYRTTNGLFNKIEDLMNVSGISNNLYEKIKAFITV